MAVWVPASLVLMKEVEPHPQAWDGEVVVIWGGLILRFELQIFQLLSRRVEKHLSVGRGLRLLGFQGVFELGMVGERTGG